jgi:fatty-acyl-CoA synthase
MAMIIGDMPDLLASRAALSGGAVALEELATGRTLTYAGLDRRTSQVAGLLAARGIGRGDRVAVLCRQRIAFFELLFACARLGAILVPLNWRMPATELNGLIADAEPVLLLHAGADGGTVAALAAPPPAIDLDGEYETLVARAAPFADRAHWPANGIWYLLYTSGTTGRPKGVIYTYRMALANLINIGTATGLGARDCNLAFLPNFHTAGINLHALPTLFVGGRLLLMESFDAAAIIGLLAAERLDMLFGVPTIYQALLDDPRFAGLPLTRVRHWGCGGAPLADALAEKGRAAGLRICNGMGMTETGPTAFLLDPADAWDRIGSVGKPQLLCAARIVDAADRPVADGKVGEVQFAGPGVTPGYWRDEAATAAAFTADGWLRSGDLARRDAEGFTWIAGRRKEMFISGGENVYPAEVENVLAACPGVIDVAVLARPDPKWGEVGRAFVQLAPDRPPDEAALAAYCRQRLAPYKVPAAFEFVPDFPRTSAGKIRKHLLP